MQNSCRIFYTLKKMQQPVSMPPKCPRLEKLLIKSFGIETSWLWSITRLWTVWTTSVTRFGNVRGSTRGRKLTKCKRSSSRKLWWILTTACMCKEWHPSGSTCKKGRRAATAGPMSWRGHPAVSDWQTMTFTAHASDTPRSHSVINFLFSSPSICEKQTETKWNRGVQKRMLLYAASWCVLCEDSHVYSTTAQWTIETGCCRVIQAHWSIWSQLDSDLNCAEGQGPPVQEMHTNTHNVRLYDIWQWHCFIV